MMLRSVLVPILLMTMILCDVVSADQPASVEKLVEKMAARLKTIESFEAEGKRVVRMKTETGDRKREWSFQTVLKRPDKLKMRTELFTLVSDGKQVWVRFTLEEESPKVVQVGEDLLGAIDEVKSDRLFLSPSVRALLSDEPGAVLSEFVRNHEIVIHPNEIIDGHSCWVVDVTFTPPPHNVRMILRLWIDKKWALVRRQQLMPGHLERVRQKIRENPGSDLTAPPDDVQEMESLAHCTSLRVNQPVDDSEFAIPPTEEDDSGFTLESWFSSGNRSFDGEYFRRKWTADAGRAERNFMWRKYRVRLPVARLAVRMGKELAILDPSTGAEAGERIPVPRCARRRNEMDAWPDYTVLRTPSGFVAVARQTLYEKEEGTEDGEGTTYSPQKVSMVAFTGEGEELWDTTVSREFNAGSIAPIPLGKGNELLFAGSYHEFRLYTPSGKKLVTQEVPGTGPILITDTDQDGGPEFIVMGSPVRCYELKVEKVLSELGGGESEVRKEAAQ